MQYKQHYSLNTYVETAFHSIVVDQFFFEKKINKKRFHIKISTYSSKQWAAVRINCSLRMLPPQTATPTSANITCLKKNKKTFNEIQFKINLLFLNCWIYCFGPLVIFVKKKSIGNGYLWIIDFFLRDKFGKKLDLLYC